MVALKRIGKTIQENAFEQKKKNGLKFYRGLALIGLQTTGPWCCFFFQVKVDNVDDGDHNDRDQMLKVIVLVLMMTTTVMLIMMIVCITRGYKCVDSSFNQKEKSFG